MVLPPTPLRKLFFNLWDAGLVKVMIPVVHWGRPQIIWQLDAVFDALLTGIPLSQFLGEHWGNMPPFSCSPLNLFSYFC